MQGWLVELWAGLGSLGRTHPGMCFRKGGRGNCGPV